MLGVPPCTVDNNLFKANCKLIKSSLSPVIWNTQLRLTFNALPFDRRLRSANILNTPSPLKCLFCGTAEDSLRHVYGDCEIIK